MRREIPTNYKRIRAILDEMYETFCKKQRNYGPGNISVGTSLETEDDIKVELTGLWFRKNEKDSKIVTISGKRTAR